MKVQLEAQHKNIDNSIHIVRNARVFEYCLQHDKNSASEQTNFKVIFRSNIHFSWIKPAAWLCTVIYCCNDLERKAAKNCLSFTWRGL